MRQFTVSVAEGVFQKENNAFYPKQVTIASLEELEKVARWDHVGGIFRNNHRNNPNLTQANVALMDADNDNIPNSDDWLTPEKITEILPDVEFCVVYSRNHMKVKTKKDKKTGEQKIFSPRPRFHCYFPLAETYSSFEPVKAMKNKLWNLIPKFDVAAKDAARFFNGVENPQTAFFAGSLCVDEFLSIPDVEEPTVEEPTKKSKKESKTEQEFADDGDIPVGERHGFLIKTAFSLLCTHSEQKARQLYDKACLRCKPQKPLEEVQRIWSYAVEHVKQFKERQKKVLTPGIIDRELKKLGITVEYDVVRKILRISDLPENDNAVPEGYYSLSQSAKKRENEKLLPAYLVSHFKTLNFGANSNFIVDVLNSISTINAYNPIQAMLESTVHDGVDRFGDLYRVLGIDSDSYDDSMSRAFLRKWLHQAIAISFNTTGSYGNEFVLVLQGGQGIGKTNFFRKLAMLPDLFREGMTLDVNSKDSVMKCTNVWICELGELDATLRKEQAALKSFLTSHSDVYRKPYGRNNEKIERRTAFCATVNPSEVIRDSTGSRRFVFIHVDTLDRNFIFQQMTTQWCAQLWRQVYNELYLPNPTGFYLNDVELKYCQQMNEAYTVPVETEIELRDILKWVDDKLPLEKWIRNWRWTTLTALQQNSPILKELRPKSPKLGAAITKIIRSLGLNPDEFKRRTHAGYQYLLPPCHSRFEAELQ